MSTARGTVMRTNTASAFPNTAKRALKDDQLQTALQRARYGFINKRQRAVQAVDDFDALTNAAQAAKQRALADWASHLEQFETRLQHAGGHTHWAETPEQAVAQVRALCHRYQAKTVTKGKSMIRRVRSKPSARKRWRHGR